MSEAQLHSCKQPLTHEQLDALWQGGQEVLQNDALVSSLIREYNSPYGLEGPTIVRPEVAKERLCCALDWLESGEIVKSPGDLNLNLIAQALRAVLGDQALTLLVKSPNEQRIELFSQALGEMISQGKETLTLIENSINGSMGDLSRIMTDTTGDYEDLTPEVRARCMIDTLRNCKCRLNRAYTSFTI